MKRIGIGFTGPSNSGKTNLIVKLSTFLSTHHRVCVIKSDPKDKAAFDTPGKDSARFYQTGADVIVASPTRTAHFSQSPKTLEQMVHAFGDFDYLIVEGLREFPINKIAVFENQVDESYLPYVQGIATFEEHLKDITVPTDISTLNIRDVDAIINWIDANGTRL